MGLSQSTEVSEGGTYGYHVHGVSSSAFFIFGTACNVSAAYLHLALYANPMLANGWLMYIVASQLPAKHDEVALSFTP